MEEQLSDSGYAGKTPFLTYDQQELITRCGLQFDNDYLYVTMLSEPDRIHRLTGDMERGHHGSPEDSSFKAVFTNMEMTECKWPAHNGQAPDEDI